MPKSRIPSPARSQGAITPRRHKPRGSRSVCSPALSTASGRLTSVIDQFREKNLDSFALSPVNRRSVLTDDTDIEEPRRKSWWKNLNENSRDVMELLQEDKPTEVNNAIEDIVEIEVLSQEKKNYTIDLPESSDNESINSIVLPQRRLFTQKENQPQKKFSQLVGTRETLAKLHKSSNNTQGDKTIVAGAKDLFQGTKRSKPIFPAALLNISPNKTAADKTKENVAAEPKLPVKNIFGNRPANKRKNMFADFIVSESEDEISEIQPKVTMNLLTANVQKKVEQRRISSISKGREQSPTSSINTDIDLDDDWKHLPSSTMVDNQLDEMVVDHTPVKRARLSRLTEKEVIAEITTNKSIASKSKASPTSKEKTLIKDKTLDKTKQSDKSSVKNKTRTSPRNKDATKAEEQNKTNKSAVTTESEKEQIIQDEDDDENNLTLTYEDDDEIEEQHQDNNAQNKNQTDKLSNKTQNTTKRDKSKIESQENVNKSQNKTGNNRSLRSNTFNKSQNDDENKSLNRSKKVNKSVKSDMISPDKNTANNSRIDKSSNNANRSQNKSNKSVNKSKKSMNKANKSLNESLNTSKQNNSIQQKTRLSKATKTVEETQDNDQNSAQDNIDGVLENAQPEINDIEQNVSNVDQEMEVEEQESRDSEVNSNIEADQSTKDEQEEVEDQDEIAEDEQTNESVNKNITEAEDESQENENEQESQNDESQEVSAEERKKVNEELNEKTEKGNESLKNKTQEVLHQTDKSQKANKSTAKINEHVEEKVNKSHVNTTKINDTKADKSKIVKEGDKFEENKANNVTENVIQQDDIQEAKVIENIENGDEVVQHQEMNTDDVVDQNQEYEQASESQKVQEDDEVQNGEDDAIPDIVHQSQEVGEEVIESQEVDRDVEMDEGQDMDEEGNESDDEVDQSQEVENDEVNESQEVEEEDEVNESQEVDNDEVNESQETDDEVNESQEVEDEVNESQEVEDEVNESQEVEDEGNESPEVEDEGNESQEVEDEVNESQEVEDEVNESEEVEDEVNESQEAEDENNQSQEVEASEEEENEDEEDENNESETEEMDQSNDVSQEQASDDEADVNQEIENEQDEENESLDAEEDQEMEDSTDADRAIATDEMSEDDQEEMEVDEDQNEESNNIEPENAQSEEVIEQSDITHDTTGRNRKKIKSPEVILHDKTNQEQSFIVKGRNTSIRETKSMYKGLNIRPSLAPARDSLGLSDGTRDSSAEGSGWDSHRTTRKTLRQTFGKDFTPRKSLRALVMEKSAKQTQHMETLNNVTAKFPQANSTEFPDDSNRAEDVTMESDHELSRRTRQTTLEAYLQKMKQQNIEKKMKMEEAIRNSLTAPSTRDTLSIFKVPSRPAPRKPQSTTNKPRRQIKSVLGEELPADVIEDMKYKPPKRFQPANASWITKRLYKFLEAKLEPKYDYKARIRAEKLVETMYQFVKEVRRVSSAPPAAVAALKLELARLDVVSTHFDFYEFFHEFMPREVRVKVVPDVVNNIPLPRHGVFSEILRGNNVQG